MPFTSLAGAFGAGQAAGTNKRITWSAGVDWNGKYTPNMRFEVTATDTEVPVLTDGFVKIDAGSFQMGDATGVGYSNEKPVHTVMVSAFYMAKYESTKGIWDTVRAWGLTHGYTDLAVGGGSAANHPVHSVNWYDVVKWCNARSEMENLTPCYTVSGLPIGRAESTRIATGAPMATACPQRRSGRRRREEPLQDKTSRGETTSAMIWRTIVSILPMGRQMITATIAGGKSARPVRRGGAENCPAPTSIVFCLRPRSILQYLNNHF